MANHLAEAVTIEVSLAKYYKTTQALNTIMIFTVSNGTLLSGTVMEFTKPTTSAEKIVLGTNTYPFVDAIFAQRNVSNPIVKVIGVNAHTEAEYDTAYGVDSDFFFLLINSRILADQTELLAWCAGKELIGIVQSSDVDNKDAYIPNVGTAICDLAKDEGIENFVTIYHTQDTDYVDAAWVGMKAVNPDINSINWRYANLVGPTVSINITDAELSNLRDKNANTYLYLMKTATMAKGQTPSNNFIDEVVTKYWTLIRVRESIVNLLLTESNNNRKIPYNNQGIGQIHGAVSSALKMGVDAGHFNKYVISMPNSFNISGPTKQTRKLTFTFQCELTGAIEEADVVGYLSYDAIVTV